ncbi:amino acid ABC transporter permease [Calidifontibacter sp. DB0510]|uniref:Amino acid ABC transporter permease n=1 Tax=Metallococcus carri TaxID=1656884 RepID=A0A967B3Q0_9MICO|nr:amino acid ABC transporter permease [Metallococcus carri]NHN56795.1 amino acid ABC transporter permease [Metallococcus carri]NOP37828.1 amino acid ABC transporter permease [Calidifontibacter sp. DB2511S]
MSAGVLFDAPGPKARRRHLILTGVGVLVVLAIAWVIFQRLADKNQLTSAMWKPFLQSSTWTSYLLPGLWGTIKAALISILLAGLLGGLLALARMSEIGPLRWIASVWVEIFRAIPVLLMMLFSYGYLSTSNVVDSEVAPLYATVTGLVLYNSAVVCEVIRSGVDQLPKGQREAGLSIGLRPSETLRIVLLPQAITAMLPALISQLVVVLKDTALGYNVLYGELLYNGKTSSVGPANIVPTIFVIALIYILLNYSIGKIAEYVEGRLKRRGRTVADTGVVDGAAEPAAPGGTAV